MMSFVVEPDVAISLGEDTVIDTSVHPPRVDRLHVVMEGWFGDGLLEVFPCFVFREEMSRAIEEAHLTGVEFVPLTMTESDDFRHEFPDTKLPSFVWGKIEGRSRQSDFFLSEDHKLVVSERALKVLEAHDLASARIEPMTN